MDPEIQEVDPNANVDPGASAAAADAGAAGADAQQQQDQGADGAAKPHGNAGKTPWYMARIHEETNKARAAEERATQEARRAADAEALLARMQSGAKPDGQPQPAAQPQPRAAVPQDQYQHDVRAGAEQLRFYENTNEVKQAGFAQFGTGFGAVLETLTAVGATSNDFVYDVLSVDKANAHVIFDTLAKDPERAAALVNMNPRARIAELTRMTMTDAKPAAQSQGQQQAKPASISKAPAPKPAIEPSAPASETDWLDPAKLDNMTEAEANAMFSRNWDAKYSGRGRAA